MSKQEKHTPTLSAVDANTARETSLTWDQFMAVDLRAGTVIKVESFPEARFPAWKIWADFGEGIGVLKSSARVTDYYSADDLVGMQILGVVNFPPRQIGPFRSEFLVTGLVQEDGSVILAVPERAVPNGTRLG